MNLGSEKRLALSLCGLVLVSSKAEGREGCRRSVCDAVSVTEEQVYSVYMIVLYQIYSRPATRPAWYAFSNLFVK